MQQVKLFKGIESETTQLEAEINAWLRESGARVISITGNIAPQTPAKEIAPASLSGRGFLPSDLFVIVLYEMA